MEENGAWNKNTEELCRNAYSRVSLITKLKYAGASTEDLLHTYKLFITSRLEYCGVAFHSTLTKQQEDSLERCQAVCLRAIYQESYISYSAALEMCSLRTMFLRRQDCCLQFSLKSLRHDQNKRMFPANSKGNRTIEDLRYG